MQPQTPDSSMVEINRLITKLQNAQGLPNDLRQKSLEQISRIALGIKYGGNFGQIDITAKYIDWITNLPWETRTQDTLDIAQARKLLDINHFGLEGVKERIVEFLSVLAVQRKNTGDNHFHAPAPFFVGLAGTGKTTFAMSIAEALGRKFVRIPFGGLANAFDLRGQAKTTPTAEPGIIMRALRSCGSKNPVILLDELDRIDPESKSAIMGVLIELLDPAQNSTFHDYFIDYPFDLSEVLFIATANNTGSIATAVLDRLELIQMPSYTDVEKIAIGKQFVLPHLVKNLGLPPGAITIEESLWPVLVRPLGFEPGIRSLERLMDQIVRRCAVKIASGQPGPFVINGVNVREFTG